MKHLKPILAASWLAFFAVEGGAAETNGFLCQTVNLPAKRAPFCFADLDHQGRSDLLALDLAGKRLLIYRQGASGFSNAPDQSLALPPQTAWITPYHVEAHPALELLMSTATGLVYFRQNAGVFETESRQLIKVDQVFTNEGWPYLTSLATNAGIPVITATQAWRYQRNEALEWQPGPPMDLKANRNRLYIRPDPWSMGPNPSYSLNISQSFLATSNATPVDEKPENDAIGKLMAAMKKASSWGIEPNITRVDLNGDGQKDFILWQAVGQMDADFKTDVYIFLRGADGQLPERPTQVLHCRGYPIGTANQAYSPIVDLKGDGTYELVLVEPKVEVASVSGAVDMFVSRGVDMELTIRQFNHGAFSRSADAAVSFKTLFAFMSLFGYNQWPFGIRGDFNGDGRPDLLVQRTATEWEVFFSANNGHWFAPSPSLKFELPALGGAGRQNFDIQDLNGDGRADIVLRDLDAARIFIYLTQPQPAKGNP